MQYLWFLIFTDVTCVINGTAPILWLFGQICGSTLHEVTDNQKCTKSCAWTLSDRLCVDTKLTIGALCLSLQRCDSRSPLSFSHRALRILHLNLCSFTSMSLSGGAWSLCGSRQTSPKRRSFHCQRDHHIWTAVFVALGEERDELQSMQ